MLQIDEIRLENTAKEIIDVGPLYSPLRGRPEKGLVDDMRPAEVDGFVLE